MSPKIERDTTNSFHTTSTEARTRWDPEPGSSSKVFGKRQDPRDQTDCKWRPNVRVPGKLSTQFRTLVWLSQSILVPKELKIPLP